MQGQSVSIEFVSADASTAAAVTLKDSTGATRALAANEILLIDTLTAALATAVLLVQVFADIDGDSSVDAGELLASFAPGNGASRFSGGKEGQAVTVGVTPSVKASGAGVVNITGTGRIVVQRVTNVRAAYKEKFGGH